MENVAFIEETELDERGLRRLAQSRGVALSKTGSSYYYNTVELDADEAWAVISQLPQKYTLGGKNVAI